MLRFNEFEPYYGPLTEAAQQGFEYEKNAAVILKNTKLYSSPSKTYKGSIKGNSIISIVPGGFTPAGAGSDIPDLKIQKKGVNGNKPTGCELKISAADAGSLVIKYNNGKWEMGSIVTKVKGGEDITNDEKKFIKELADEVNLIDLINKNWKEEPYKGGTSDKIKEEKAKLTSLERYKRDLNMFKDIKGIIPATKIEQYYNSKDTYYINVGTHGFYLLGSSNPLKLESIPRFGTSAKASYRARCQPKSSTSGGPDKAVSYQFTLSMIFSIPKGATSDYNIAPIIGKNNIKINMNKLELDWFLK